MFEAMLLFLIFSSNDFLRSIHCPVWAPFKIAQLRNHESRTPPALQPVQYSTGYFSCCAPTPHYALQTTTRCIGRPRISTCLCTMRPRMFERSMVLMPCIPIVSTMELGQWCVVCNIDMLGASCAMLGASCRWSYNTLRRKVQKVPADDPVAAHRNENMYQKTLPDGHCDTVDRSREIRWDPQSP